MTNCHNPTNNPLKKLDWCGIIMGKKRPHQHTTDMITFLATSSQPWKLIFGMLPYSNPTRRNMEDNLKCFLQIEDDLNFF
jgi:hypothetical protein